MNLSSIEQIDVLLTLHVAGNGAKTYVYIISIVMTGIILVMRPTNEGRH